MDFIKKHKLLVIVFSFILILLIIIGILLKTLLVDNSKDEYGNRLSGMEDVIISKKTSSKLETELKKIDEVSDVSYRLQGRLVYVNLTFNEEVSLETSKEIGAKVLEYFSDEEKAYYDIQVILNSKNKESEEFPKIGYKHKTSETIVW